MHLPLADGLRARDLKVDIQRRALVVALKRGSSGSLLEGTLAQPVICDDSDWMVEDGVLVLTLAKDNLRAENTGPSTEWWHGIFAGEDTLDTSAVSVGDYVKTSSLRPDQRAELEEAHLKGDAAAADKRRAEATLPTSQREALASLRASFPDIPIEWGDTSGGSG